MFASETILLNPSVACLEFTNAAKWRTRDVIITDRAVYFFATVKPIEVKKGANQSVIKEEITVANYLNAPYERLDVKNFRALKPSGNDAPQYQSELPALLTGFTKIIELANRSNGKHRLVAC